MRSKHILIVLSVVAAMAAAAVVVVSAGNPNTPPGPPEMTSSYRLEDIYDRLSTGAAGTQITFTEPISGPTVGTGNTLDEIMGIAPQADDTNGAAASQVVSGRTYWGLRSGAWGIQTGTGTIATYAAAVPKTGQTTCWDTNGVLVACAGTGQDGDLQKGVDWSTSTRFITGTTGVVTDTLTGLIWLKDANCTDTVGGVDKSPEWLDWESALTWSNNLAEGDCGLSDGSVAGDWRLPNMRELYSLIDYGEYAPALPSGHPFSGVQAYYWSSTSFANGTVNAWRVYMPSGYLSYLKKTVNIYVWPVRAGQ